MVRNRIQRAMYLLMVLSLLVPGCARAGIGQPRSEPVALKVLLLPFLSHAPLFIAEEEGFFAEQGLEIEFVKMTTTDEAIPALAQGQLDVAPGVMSASILNAMAHDAEIRLVADKGYLSSAGCAYSGLVARADLVEDGMLGSPAQLEARTIDINRASMEGYYVDRLLKTVGLTLDDIEITDVPPAVELESLENGAIDLASMSEPWVTRALDAGHGVLWMPVQQVLPDFQFAFIMFGPTLLEKDRDAGSRFMVAYLKAVRQYNQGKTERNLELLAEFTGLDRELLEEACWLTIREHGSVDAQSILDFQVWAEEQGLVDDPVTEDQLWDPGFVEYANEVLGAASP